MTYDLWSYPNRAGAKERTTSLEAAHRIEAKGRARTLRKMVLEWFSYDHESTADEVAEQLGEDILAIRPRVTELHKQGWLEHTGQRRKNASGASAHVWRITTVSNRRAG